MQYLVVIDPNLLLYSMVTRVLNNDLNSKTLIQVLYILYNVVNNDGIKNVRHVYI